MFNLSYTVRLQTLSNSVSKANMYTNKNITCDKNYDIVYKVGTLVYVVKLYQKCRLVQKLKKKCGGPH